MGLLRPGACKCVASECRSGRNDARHEARRPRPEERVNYLVWLLFIVAALLEVSGDALVRRGLRGRAPLWILIGCAALALYGLLVNSVRWDFSKLLGVYVAFFAAMACCSG